MSEIKYNKIKYNKINFLILAFIIVLFIFISYNTSNGRDWDIKGKVSNNFGVPLNRDIDNDGDLDSAVILSSLSFKNLESVLFDSMGIDDNGNIYILGEYNQHKPNYDNNFYVIKINSDGKIDKTFENNITNVIKKICSNKEDEFGESIFVKSNALFVRVENFKNHDYIIKLNSDGNIDTKFGNNGLVDIQNIIKLGYGKYAADTIYVDNKGRVYVIGNFVNQNNVCVIRLNEDGNLDNTFGDRGIILIDNIVSKMSVDSANSIYVDNEGKIYITGDSFNPDNWTTSVFVAKINEDGSMDNTFGNNGIVIIPHITFSEDKISDSDKMINPIGRSIYVDSNDNIYVAGITNNEAYFDLFIVKLNKNGNLDNTFGNNGKVIINDIKGKDWNKYPYSICVDNQGKVYITGTSMKGTLYSLKGPITSFAFVIRLNSDGKLDNTFGKNGKLLLNSVAGGNQMLDSGESMCLDNKGNLYIGGSSFNSLKRRYYAFVIKIE